MQRTKNRVPVIGTPKKGPIISNGGFKETLKPRSLNQGLHLPLNTDLGFRA